MGGFAIAGAMVAVSGIYSGTRLATNIATLAQAYITAKMQADMLFKMIDKQENMWDHVAAKQIQCVEVALNEFIRGVDELLPTFKGAYPDIPVPARLIPPDPQEVQFNQMVDNLKNMPRSAEYMSAANHWHRINYAARAEFLSPGFANSFYRHMRQVESLLDGQMPIDEAVGVTSDVAENAAMNGRIGNTCRTTSAAMGIRRIQMQALGREELARRVTMMQGVSPVETEVTVDSLMLKPERRLTYALELAQLLQNDLQNANNAAAQKPPHLMAELQTRLQRTVAILQFNANKANMQNQFVPNFPALFAPAISNLTKAVGDTIKWEKDPDSDAQSQNTNPWGQTS